jgi:peptidyl-tRNA hydrolase
MVFVVRKDLQWSKQKLAVMTAHAALALFKKLYKARHPALMQWVSSMRVCVTCHDGGVHVLGP